MDRCIRTKPRARPLAQRPVLVLVLVLLLLLLLPPGDGTTVARRQLGSKKKKSIIVKTVGCKGRGADEVLICAFDAFRVSIAEQPNSLVLRRRRPSDDPAVIVGSAPPSRKLQEAITDMLLYTTALTVIDNDLIVRGTLRIGNLTISDDDTSALQGPPGELGCVCVGGSRERGNRLKAGNVWT